MGLDVPLTLSHSQRILRVSVCAVHPQLPLAKLLEEVTKYRRMQSVNVTFKCLTLPAQISQFDFYAK